MSNVNEVFHKARHSNICCSSFWELLASDGLSGFKQKIVICNESFNKSFSTVPNPIYQTYFHRKMNRVRDRSASQNICAPRLPKEFDFLL